MREACRWFRDNAAESNKFATPKCRQAVERCDCFTHRKRHAHRWNRHLRLRSMAHHFPPAATGQETCTRQNPRPVCKGGRSGLAQLISTEAISSSTTCETHARTCRKLHVKKFELVQIGHSDCSEPATWLCLPAWSLSHLVDSHHLEIWRRERTHPCPTCRYHMSHLVPPISKWPLASRLQPHQGMQGKHRRSNKAVCRPAPVRCGPR